MDVWSQFVSTFTNNVDFRLGFFWGLGFAVAAWGLFAFFFGAHARWLKVRQFFEPIKKPAKPAVETGPSPASMMFGCAGYFLLVAIGLGALVTALYLYAIP